MSKKEIVVSELGSLIPKAVQDRLRLKMLDVNDDKIIDRMQQINSHKEAIARLTKEIEGMLSIGI